MTLVQSFKADESIALIQQMLEGHPRPCVLWSGGKDSQVLLHLVRGVNPAVEVVCWREPWLPKKQKFVNAMIARWNLTVWDWHPERVSLCKGGGRIDVLNHYSWGAQPLILARGTERPIAGQEWLCGRDTFLNRPLGKFAVPFGIAFHGHKSADVDPCSGPIPLETDVMNTPGVLLTVFPLRRWDDEDVFAYSELHDVPIDLSRYRKVDGRWEVLPYQERNPDYYPACFKCVDPDEAEFVRCPKLNAQINNVSNYVSWEKPKLSYCNLRTEEESEEMEDALRSRHT